MLVDLRPDLVALAAVELRQDAQQLVKLNERLSVGGVHLQPVPHRRGLVVIALGQGLAGDVVDALSGREELGARRFEEGEEVGCLL